MRFQKLKYLVILTLFLIFQTDTQYQIPSYYGYWSKRFFKPQAILSGSFAIFEINFSIDMNYDKSIIYFADEAQHCIFSYYLVQKRYQNIAGRCSRSGDRVGNVKSSYFNGPSSVTYYKPDPQRESNAMKSKLYIVRNQICSLSSVGCQLNQVELASPQLKLQLKNIRIQPFYDLFSFDSNLSDQYLYISDKLNHCIKKVTLKTKYTQVVAGFCGRSGFLDGPLGFNRLNRPSNIGVDAKGVIYFFDQGNQYMRRLTFDKIVQTLLNGACKQYKRENQENRKVKNFQLKKMICYENWIQKKTASVVQHYFDEDLLNICSLHSSKCPSEM